MPTVSFQAPTDYSAEQATIDRQRRLSEALLAQSQQPLESNQTAGGWVVPTSPFAGLAKALNQGVAGLGQKRADERQKALGDKYLREGQEAITRSAAALRDQPERPAMMDPQEREQMADQGTAAPANIPAEKADAYRALSLAMRHPEAKAMIGPLAMQKIGGEIDMEMLSKALGGGTATAAPSGAPGVTAAPAGGPVAAPGATPGAPVAAGGYPGWMPSPALLGAGKHGPEVYKALAAANKPSDLQQDLAAAGVTMNSPEGRQRVLDPSARLASQQATLVEYTVPGTDRKIKVPNSIANILATQQAPDAESAAVATRIAKDNGMNVNIGVAGALGGLTGGASPLPLGEAEKKGMEKGAEATMGLIPKELSDSLEGAQSALKRHTTLEQIHGALQSGKAITGPGATGLTWLQRIGETAFGPGNKKSVAETQQLVQGLADLALSGASAMRGQGAITENERLLLMKAKSGVQNMLPAELNELLKIFDKQNRWEIGLHNSKMDRAERAKFQNLDYWGRVNEPPPLGGPKIGTALSPEALEFMRKNGIQPPQ